ncbi:MULTISPECIES: nucleotidyl transferase AbiEii/AbiGii toxin family protein [Lactobacillaceae]|uniref:Abortive phage infection protein n=1 Tax=Lactiplantibacillus plantarum 2025 TaxID=1385856 RepID=A0A837NEQ5_LACPN|nr:MULTISPECIES: nucleotidyl transferase AbiEii/AbiGii toxin family protein [Lactobacillaceae]MCH7259516.1 nucleotidyl transferase AbiEii/AbiGii toxin family protein [Lactiplantibacillus sp. ME-2]MDN6004856.1 nucleotidyl transferase AbiEii/AbiGii toxin family protein [Enterococcus sp.]MDN6544800.1 nucleotidyl transferase AbiEii/AbiGii toxin family protein [Enterococcaceae bacterium]ASD33178.1 nucleotidyl transferase AbiEii/AbiGii toxin family protein [Lactiplantibacillus plantarum]AUH36440.1 n
MKLEFTDQKQFLARIRKLAKERKITPQIMLQEIILDDLIDRISNSPYQNNLVLKGGFLLASLIGTDTRSTRDIDTSIVGLPVTEDKMKSVFREICDIELPDDIIKLSIVKIDEIREDDEYSGYRIHIRAQIYTTRVDVKIDISTGDVITERAMQYGHKMILEDRTIQIMAYTVETIIAEKLETIVSRADANTRLKDFYDLYLLNRQSKAEIKFNILKKAIQATSEKRETADQLGAYISVLTALKASPSLQRLWIAYQKSNEYARGIDFGITCDAAIDLIKKSGLEQQI